MDWKIINRRIKGFDVHREIVERNEKKECPASRCMLHTLVDISRLIFLWDFFSVFIPIYFENSRNLFSMMNNLVNHSTGIPAALWIFVAVFFCFSDVEAFHKVRPADYPNLPEQLSVKVEMVLMELRLVEEFTVFWDQGLNMTRYDYALGREMAPFKSSRPMKTILDSGNGKNCCVTCFLHEFRDDFSSIFPRFFLDFSISPWMISVQRSFFAFCFLQVSVSPVTFSVRQRTIVRFHSLTLHWMRRWIPQSRHHSSSSATWHLAIFFARSIYVTCLTSTTPITLSTPLVSVIVYVTVHFVRKFN